MGSVGWVLEEIGGPSFELVEGDYGVESNRVEVTKVVVGSLGIDRSKIRYGGIRAKVLSSGRPFGCYLTVVVSVYEGA
jgi:hypothetical protein